MSVFKKLRHALLGRPQAKVTRLESAESMAMRIDELPPFNLRIADLMRFDPQVRIGLSTRNGLLMAAEVEIAGDDERINRWVQHQWDALWNGSSHHLLRAKLFGFQPFEVLYKQAAGGEFRGLIEVERLIDHPPGETRLLVADEKIVGFTAEVQSPRSQVQSQREEVQSSRFKVQSRGSEVGVQKVVDLFAPQALVCTFDSDCASPYGCALLARAYPAWFEKWMPGGAKRTLRLRMIKDAYIGDIFWYPTDRRFELPDGSETTYRDLAREIAESRASGGALTLPLVYDSSGNKVFDYTPPQNVPGHTQVFRWKSDLDVEIWKALEVPPEIIQAQSSGSGFSGRWIPFAVALSAVHQELAELIRCIDRDILRPIAQLNFGRECQYEIKPRSLVEIYAEMFGAERTVGRRR